MQKKPRQRNVQNQERDRTQHFRPARSALVELTDKICRVLNIGKREIETMAQHGTRAARNYLKTIGSPGRRTRLTIAFSTSLVRRAESRSALESAAQNLAFGLYRLQSQSKTDPGIRVALLETALQLFSERNKSQPAWLNEARERYEIFLAQGEVPDWGNAIGFSASDAIQRLRKIRRGLGYAKFSPPDIKPPIQVDSIEIDDTDLQIPLTEDLNHTRVRSVSIQNFRGVAGRLDIDFVDANGKAQSCLIHGDNGVGKSTIVSAIEFACQGRIGRQTPSESPMVPRAVNLSVNASSAEVKVIFNDDAILSRTVKGNQIKVEEGDVQKAAFHLAPMSMQRSDITRFLGTPPGERGKLFIDHFSVRIREDPVPEPTELQARIVELRDKLSELSSAVGLGLTKDNVPVSTPKFNRAVSQVYFLGLPRREWEERTGNRAPAEALQLLTNYRRTNEEFQIVRKQKRSMRKASSLPLYERQVRRLGVLLGDVSGPMTAALRSITGSDWINEITIEFGRLSKISIELVVTLNNNSKVTPESFFSEGVQDLITLLFLFEVAQAAGARGQARILILDDVLQSVDSTIRLNLIDYMLTRSSGWQLFITSHDQLWREQLIQLLRKHNHSFVEREVRGWEPSEGPEVRQTHYDLTAGLWAAINQGTTSTVCAEAGRLLERVLDVLSYSLPVSVTRRQGDRYTLGDLWPPVAKKLKKTSARKTADEIEKWLHLRNLIGAHYNSWADSLSKSDADNFGLAILELLDSFYCAKCCQWARPDSYRIRWNCRCGSRMIDLSQDL